MKVVISTYTFLPDIGGVASVVANLAAAFCAMGHAVTVVTSTPEKVPDSHAYAVIRRPTPFQLIREYASADLLILSNLSLKLGYPLLFMRRSFALHHHSESAFHLSNSWWSTDRLRKVLISRAAHFMTSAYVGRQSPYLDFTIAPPFASLDQFTADIIKPIYSRADAVFVGRVEPEKGIEWLLQRWSEFREILGADKLHVVGSGSISLLLHQRYSGVPHVVFHGAQPRKETARIMGSCKYAFVPSLWAEPFGAVALEALAAEAIPIVSDRGGLPEAVPGFGHYFNPDDENSVLVALNAAKADFDYQSSNPEVRRDWQRRAQAHLAKFEPIPIAHKFIQRMCDTTLSCLSK